MPCSLFCLCNSNAQHQSRGESCWQRPPFINISTSHHFLSPLFLPWEKKKLLCFAPKFSKRVHFPAVPNEVPLEHTTVAHHLLVMKELWNLTLPIFTGKSTERSQSMPSVQCPQQQSHAAQSPPCWQQGQSCSTQLLAKLFNSLLWTGSKSQGYSKHVIVSI